MSSIRSYFLKDKKCEQTEISLNTHTHTSAPLSQSTQNNVFVPDAVCTSGIGRKDKFQLFTKEF